MRFACLLGTALLIAAPLTAQSSRDAQVAAAVLAAPADRQAGARVLGYDEAGKLTLLREGSNDMICLADNPAVEGIELNCYHMSLEPFMARGRELSTQGVPNAERMRLRYAEAESGKLKMPEKPAVLYTLHGAAYDAASNTVAQEYRRQTIYIPYATPETTGLSPQASSNAPWIMFPGTPGAHIMITPERPKS
jgi:hypothetical protein